MWHRLFVPSYVIVNREKKKKLCTGGLHGLNKLIDIFNLQQNCCFKYLLTRFYVLLLYKGIVLSYAWPGWGDFPYKYLLVVLSWQVYFHVVLCCPVCSGVPWLKAVRVLASMALASARSGCCGKSSVRLRWEPCGHWRRPSILITSWIQARCCQSFSRGEWSTRLWSSLYDAWFWAKPA